MRIFKVISKRICLIWILVIISILLGCDISKPEIIIVFDNKPLPYLEPEDVARLSLDELDIPNEKVGPKVQEYLQALEDVKKNPNNQANQLKMVEIKGDILIIIVENISLFHLRNHGMPIDIEIN